MRIAVSADEHAELVTAVIQELRNRGHEVTYFGPEKGGEADWPVVSAAAAAAVATGEADQAVVMCWTGTGASIAANKVTGIRAALCGDAETARGARRWNDANVLALSLRATSGAVAKEILEAWFGTPADGDDWNRAQLERIASLERSDSA
jgi:ribose 5-phosphate isomerase B